jgi:hypothetical protein
LPGDISSLKHASFPKQPDANFPNPVFDMSAQLAGAIINLINKIPEEEKK